MDAAALGKKKVAELQQMLRDRGLATKGLKAELVKRLLSAESEVEPSEESTTPSQPATASAPPVVPVVQPAVPDPVVSESVSAPTPPAQPAVEPPAPSTGVDQPAPALEAETTTSPSIAAEKPVDLQKAAVVNGGGPKAADNKPSTDDSTRDESKNDEEMAGVAANPRDNDKPEQTESRKEPSEAAVGSKRMLAPKSTAKKEENNDEDGEKARSKRSKAADGSAKSLTNIDTSSVVVTADSIAALAEEAGVTDTDMKEAKPERSTKVRLGGTATASAGPSPRGLAQQQPPRGLASSSPRAVPSPRPDGVRGRGQNMFAAVASSMMDEEREQPPPQTATRVLKVEGLKRPFTEPQLRERLCEDGGNITWLWMNRIKSVCLVEFELKDQAATARSSLYHERWPPKTGQKLVVSFVSREEADDIAQHAPTSVPLANRLGALPGRLGHVSAAPAERGEGRQQAAAFSPREMKSPRERERESVREREAESVRQRARGRETAPPPAKTLEELFNKTKAKPEIFWLPNTPAARARKLNALRAPPPPPSAPGGRPGPGGAGFGGPGGGRAGPGPEWRGGRR